jgi:MFS transporter, DHA2 family, multidrug resistance protein
VLCLSLVLISIDNNILNVALPTLAKPTDEGGVGATATQLQWIVDGYVIVFAGLLLTTGSLSDRFGRYRFLAIGLAVFGIGSTLSAFASSPEALISSRCLMGAAAACMMPATLSILSNVFTDPSERRKAIGVWAGASAVGGSLGPVTGGALMSHFWWGSIFLVNAPVVVLALVGGYLLVPDSQDPEARRLDPVGALLSIAFLVALLWAIIEAPVKGWGSTPVIVAFGLGALFLALFVLWELRARSPMLEIRFFENPRFSVASAAIALTFLSMYGLVFLLTQYLQGVRGFSPVEAGAVLIPQALVFLASATSAPRRVHRVGGRRVIATGLGLLAASMALMVLLDAGSSVYLVIAITMVTGAGMGQVLAPATDSIMGAVPKERAGIGSAMNDTTRQIGGALGIAVLGSILTSRYGSVITSKLADLPASVVDRVENSVSEARIVARSDPDAAAYADRIVSTSHDAFLSGMHIAMLAAAAVVAIAAVAVLRWLPARAADEPEPITNARGSGRGAVGRELGQVLEAHLTSGDELAVAGAADLDRPQLLGAPDEDR